MKAFHTDQQEEDKEWTENYVSSALQSSAENQKIKKSIACCQTRSQSTCALSSSIVYLPSLPPSWTLSASRAPSSPLSSGGYSNTPEPSLRNQSEVPDSSIHDRRETTVQEPLRVTLPFKMTHQIAFSSPIPLSVSQSNTILPRIIHVIATSPLIRRQGNMQQFGVKFAGL